VTRALGLWGPQRIQVNTDLNGSSPPLETARRIRITIDPVGGDDNAAFTTVNETLPAPDGSGPIDYGDTDVATLQTLQGALDRLPTVIRFPVFIDFPADAFAGPFDGFAFGPAWQISRFVIADAVRIIDVFLFILDAAAGIYLNGTPAETLSPKGCDIFGATSIGLSTLGMGIDAHRGSIVEIVAGTGQGQWRRILRNSATTLQIADNWNTTPDATSSWRIWVPGTTFESALYVTCRTMGVQAAIYVAPTIHVDGSAAATTPLQMQGPACLALGGKLTGSGGVLGNVVYGAQLQTLWINEAADPFFQRLVGPYFKDGALLVEGSARVGTIFSSNASVFDAATLNVQGRSLIDLQVDADGGGGGGAFLTLAGSSAVLRRPANVAASSIQGYTSGLLLQGCSDCVIAAPGLDVSNHLNEGVRISEGAILDASNGLASATPNGTYGVICRGGGILTYSALVTITGATQALRLGNAVSGADLPWAAVPAGDAISDPAELAVVRDAAGP
jgi:hypothetical protein